MDNRKKEILEKILLKEEDTLNELEELVDLASEHLRIEKESGEVLIISKAKLTNKEKIILLLIGKYFAKELGIVATNSLTLSEVSSALKVPGTTLSRPLGELADDALVRKDKDKYYIIYHKIKEFLLAKTSKR